MRSPGRRQAAPADAEAEARIATGPRVVQPRPARTHGWRVSADPPTMPSLPAATRRASRGARRGRARWSGRRTGGGAGVSAALTFRISRPRRRSPRWRRQRVGRRAHIALASSANTGRDSSEQSDKSPAPVRRGADENAATNVPWLAAAGDAAGGPRRGHQPDAPAVEAGMVDRNRPSIRPTTISAGRWSAPSGDRGRPARADSRRLCASLRCPYIEE